MYSTPDDVRSTLAPGVWPIPPESQSALTRTAADLDDDQLGEAIEEADASIDSALGRRYATPVAPVDGVVPQPIRTWSRNIAAYNATLTYRRGADLTENDPVVRRYRSTIADLTAVRDGKASLDLPGQTGPNGTANAGNPINPYGGRMFAPSDFGLGYSGGGIVGPGIAHNPWRSW